jgi:hypothetical protein
MPTISPPVPYADASRVVDDDDDYAYFWTLAGLDVPIPRWLAEIVDVPLMLRLEIFLAGFCAGLLVAAVTLLIAFVVALG